MTSTTSLPAARAAKQILGFYDAIPATDQQAFIAGLVDLLSIYPQPVLDRASSPSRGIPAHVAFPNLAKFKEKLDEWHGAHIDDLRRRGAIKPPMPTSRLVSWVRPPDVPGRLANVHIPTTSNRYASLCEWAKTAEGKFWKYGKSSAGVDGIWVPLSIWQEGTSALKKIADSVAMTIEQIRGHYAKHDLAYARKAEKFDDELA